MKAALILTLTFTLALIQTLTPTLTLTFILTRVDEGGVIWRPYGKQQWVIEAIIPLGTLAITLILIGSPLRLP